MTLSCKDIGIRKSVFVTKTQFLYMGYERVEKKHYEILLRCDLSVLKYLSNKFLFELMSLSIEKLNLNLPSVRLLNQSLHKLLLRVGDIAGSFRIVSSSKKIVLDCQH